MGAESQQIIYQETQYSKWSLVILAFVEAFLIVGYYFQLGDNPLALMDLLVISLIIILTFLAVFKLKITLTAEEITLHYAFGIINRSMKISEVDFEKIRVEDTPLYYGIGIRFTPKGWLYNTRPGKAIWIKNKAGNKTFFASCDHPEILIERLNQLN